MNKRVSILIGVGVLSLLLLVSLLMMSDATQNSMRFGRLYSGLLVMNSLGLITFVVLILLNIRRLVRQLRAGEPGSRLSTKSRRGFSSQPMASPIRRLVNWLEVFGDSRGKAQIGSQGKKR